MNTPTIEISQGQLVGRSATDIKGQTYYSFQGIPYAKPPLGNLRFKSPQPAEPWTGILNATKERSSCFSSHMVLGHMLGDEDCLFLNVYTPALPNKEQSKPLPVMVWIHGGAFMFGSGDTDVYGPEILVSENVVLVTINYRLGILGFMSFEDPSLQVPGNAGLKDQVLALRWVQQNISKFNGDPNNVTIFGESAGGASVHFQVLSPMSKGLFHRAIMQSGSTLNPWATTPTRRASKAAKLLGLESNDSKKILEFLQSQPKEKLYEIQMKLSLEEEFYYGEIAPFCPIVEAQSGEQAFLPEKPEDIIRKGTYNQVPCIFGFNNVEGMLVLSPVAANICKPEFTDNSTLVPRELIKYSTAGKKQELGDKIKKFYYGDEIPSRKNIEHYLDFNTDALFVSGILRSVKGQISTSKHPIYLYQLDVDTKLNFWKRSYDLKLKGTCHADDLGYLFINHMLPTETFDTETPEGIARHRIVKMWTAFAKTGNPNPVEKDSLVNVNWLPVTKENLVYLNIGSSLSVEKNPVEKRHKFWSDLFSK